MDLTFAARVRQARLDAGLSKKQLARRLNVSVQTVRSWESGRTKRLHPRHLQEFARIADELQREHATQAAFPREREEELRRA
jgi:transcriptional regulator with XRE-family HTH domain